MLLQGDWGSLFDEMNEEDLWIWQELIDDKVVEEEDADEMNDTEEDTGKDTGGEESEGGGDIDDEMLGDVQPESSETTQV